MGEDNINTVCRELDDLAIQMLQQMSLYIELLAAMENTVKTGSLHLAKSRYIMGNNSVSVLQLPTEDSELTAQATLTTDKTDRLTLQLSRLNVSSADAEDSAQAEADTSTSADDGLKRRKGKGSSPSDSKHEEKSDGAPENSEETPKKKKEVMQDPLKWFGVLVPQNMRQAQASFSSAVEMSVSIANVQLEMASIRTKYADLLAKKRELKRDLVIT